MCFAKYLNLILNFRPDDGIGAESLSPFSLNILAKKNKETGMLPIIFLLYILTMSDFMPKTIQTINNFTRSDRTQEMVIFVRHNEKLARTVARTDFLLDCRKLDIMPKFILHSPSETISPEASTIF